MSAAVSKAQIGAIHALKARAGLDDESYRDVLQGAAGVASSKQLTRDGAIAVIDRLKVLSGQAPGAIKGGPKPAGALDLSGPYAGICRALWISGWNLGVFEHREDTALVAFVRRQTKIDHLNWVRDAEDGSKVIEALKGWLARSAGVDWKKRGKLDGRDSADRVIAAQLARLGGERGSAGPLVQLWEIGRATSDDKNKLMKALGVEIRKRGV